MYLVIYIFRIGEWGVQKQWKQGVVQNVVAIRLCNEHAH